MSGAVMYAEAEAFDQSLDCDTQVNQYAPLVKRIAYHLMSRLPPSVQQDDLIQAGMIGLLEALRNYDASQGASFQTYARIRIRGAGQFIIRGDVQFIVQQHLPTDPPHRCAAIHKA